MHKDMEKHEANKQLRYIGRSLQATSSHCHCAHSGWALLVATWAVEVWEFLHFHRQPNQSVAMSARVFQFGGSGQSVAWGSDLNAPQKQLGCSLKIMWLWREALLRLVMFWKMYWGLWTGFCTGCCIGYWGLWIGLCIGFALCCWLAAFAFFFLSFHLILFRLISFPFLSFHPLSPLMSL